MISTEDRKKTIALINEACQVGARQAKACEVLGISERTLQRWQSPSPKAKEDQRCHIQKEPVNKLSIDEKENILKICNSEEYKSLPPSQIVPKLADQGIYVASESSFYRTLHEYGQQKHRGKSQVCRRNKPKGYIATGPNQVWTWDITYLPTDIKGVFYYLYMITDIYSRKIVGWEVHHKQNEELSSQLVKLTYLSEGISGSGKKVVLHSDNGSPMKGATMLATLQNLGVVPSFSRPSVSNDNPYSEALFKTLKYNPEFPSKPFTTISTAREWVLSFVRWYNDHHQHSKIKFITPNERHKGLDKQILENRKKVYQLAKGKHPERWSGNIRNWDTIDNVSLNPEYKKNIEVKQVA